MPRPRYREPHIPNLGRILREAHAVARAEAIAGLTDWATEQRDDFVERIEDQRFVSFNIIYYPETGTNLSPRWLLAKERADADLRTMIATGHYKSQIRVFKKGRKDRGRFEVRIGFHHAAKARNLDGSIAPVLLSKVARTHEFGSEKMKIPPRPHWGPQANRMRRAAPAAAREISARIARKLSKSFRTLVEDRR
tara:strand:- start:839 stop:1420 length:582 start_codon:yes stop_codon:yes gene_type:complete